MCVRYVGFALLVWFPAVLHATETCSAPKLDHGYFVPVQETYPNGTRLSYACDEGHKLAAEGWWATSTCENGTWTPKPQCIDEKHCIPPKVANAKYAEDPKGWYNDKRKLVIKCDKGYESKKHALTAQCKNGEWLSLPVCEKSNNTCGYPPKIQNAVIVKQKYQEVFAVDSPVRYECEDGYTAEGGDTKKIVYCMSGNWSDVPKCTKPDTGSGSAGGHTTSTGRETQPGGGGRDPDTGHGGSAGGLTTSTGGGASSTSSGSKEGEVELRRVAINNCGAPPRVENGDVVQTQSMFLKYQCIDFYSLEGSDRVACYSNGQWSDVPTCRATYCSVDTDADRRFESVGVQFLRDGEEVPLECKKKRWTPNRWSMVRCTDTTLTFSDCCLWASIKVGNC
uniref:Sushi domain-containing protein n=1 Tax=Anabas testudineus TaxID=64144 RepID=A0A7N6BEN8_ANATE